MISGIGLLSGCKELLQAIAPADDKCCCYNVSTGSAAWVNSCSSDNSGTTCVGEEFPQAAEMCGAPPSSQLNGVLKNIASGRQLRLTRVASLGNAQDTRTDSCVEECNKGGAFCLKSSFADKQTINNGVDVAVEWLSSSELRLPKARAMSAFGVATDPCERSDVYNFDGTIQNIGERCTVTSAISKDRNAQETLTISLPREVRAASIVDDKIRTIRFADHSLAPEITFSREDYQSDFGGPVSDVFFLKDRLVLETTKGCMQLQLK